MGSSPNFPDLTNPEPVRASLAETKAELYNDHPVPYQFLVLLWAISRAKYKYPRLAAYHEIKGQLAEWLQPFKVSTSIPNPANPWYALGNCVWWEIRPPIPDSYKQVNELNTVAGLRDLFYRIAAEDPGWIATVVESIVDRGGDSPDLRYLIVTLGLSSGLSTAPANALVEKVPVEQHKITSLLKTGLLHPRYKNDARCLYKVNMKPI